MALDAAPRRLRPEQHVCAGVVAALQRQGPGNIRHRLRLDRELGKQVGGAFVVHRLPIQTGTQKTERVIELIPCHGLSAPAVVQLSRLMLRKPESIFDPGETPAISERQIAPLTACVGECDQMRGQIAAVDRGDVLRIERTQVLCVVPIVEMTSKAGEIAHGR